MVMNARKYQALVGSAVEASAAASASVAATSSSAASSSSAAASSPTSAAAPAAEVLVLEALDLLSGGGGGPSLYRVLGGLGLDNRPNLLADFLTPHDLDVGSQRSARTIADAPPTAVHRY